MAYEALWSDSFEQDVDETVSYHVECLRNPQAARNLLDELDRRVSEIEAFPEGSALARDERLRAEGYRVSRVRGFVVLYQVDDVGGRVLLTRFVYGRRNYARLL